MRNLQALGLVLAAVLVSNALLASAAPAQFTANTYPTTVTSVGEPGNEVITIDGFSAECNGHFEGTMSEASTMLTLKGVYSNCKAFGFASGTVDMNGCDFVLHSNGEVDIECPAGKSILVSAGGCEADIGSQTGLNNVALSNNANHVDMKFAVKSVTANVTKDPIFCPFHGTGHKGAEISRKVSVTTKPVSGGTSASVD